MIHGGRHSPAAFVLSLIFGLFLSVSFVFTPVLAATTDTISFQSKLVNANGTNIPNNTYNFRFRIFSASTGGTALWSEDRSISVSDGVVSADLGTVTTFGSTLFDNADLYLQICFDANGTVGDSSDTNCDTVSHRYEEVFSTRKPITAVPLAFRAKALTDGAGNSFGPNSFFKQGGNAFGAAAVLGTTDSNTVTILANNAAAMTVLTSGYVGIGTTGPSYPLHVVATTSTAASYAAGFSNTGADTGTTYENGILVSSVSTTGTGVSNAGYQAGAYINTALSGNGTLDTLRGLWINNIAGQSSGTGTVTNHYGIDIDINQGTGTNTNAYGVRIRDVEGTSDYGIYQEGANDDNYFAGSVGIGVASPGAKLEILGTADDQQLIVRGNGTQTANLQEWQANAGTVYSQIQADGSFLYSRTGLSSNDVYGVKSIVSGSGNRTRAFEAQVTFTGVGYDLTGTNTAGAYYGSVYSASGSGGAMASFIAGGTATGASTTIGQYIGFLGKAPVEANSGAITQVYGLYLNDFNVATTNFAIVTNAGNIVFNEGGDASTDFRVEGDADVNLLFTDAGADLVGIGTNTPGQKLSIAGTLGVIEGGVTPTYYTIFQGGDQAADLTYTLPTTSVSGVLTNNGSGVLSWVAGGSSGDITDVGSMTTGAVFADATADDDWLGLGAAAGRIEFDDQATDEVNILDAKVGIGTGTPTHRLDVAAGTLGDQIYALNVVATMPATPTAMQNGIYFDITGSGTASQTSIAARIDYKAGYTGSSSTRGLLVFNANAGTGNNLQLSAATTTPTGNTGISTAAYATTTGLNIGTASLAENGNLNIGLFGRATIAKNSATNIGVAGFGLNTGTTPIQIGGYFGLQNATPTFESAALIADNGSQTSPIFLARDNGTIAFGIYDGGNVGIGASVPAQKLSVAGTLGILEGGGTPTYYTVFQGGDQAGTITYTLPVNAGSSGNVLRTDGSGVLSWGAGGMYSASNTVSNGSYLTVNHGQATYDLMSTAWYYDTIASQWRSIDNGGSTTIKHALQNEWDDAASAGRIRVNTRLTNVELAPSVNTGDGADGAITISGDKSINSGASSISGRTCTDVGGTGGDAPYYQVATLATNSVTLQSSPSNPTCLKAGDEVLLINLRGNSTSVVNTGNYETLRVASVSTYTVTFTTAKTKYYGDGAANDTNVGTGINNQIVMLQRVPNYTNVTVNSGINFYPDAYDGHTGGVMFFRATGTVTVTGTIHANGKGYYGVVGGANNDILATRTSPGDGLWTVVGGAAGMGGLADASSPTKDGGAGTYSGGGGGGKYTTSAGGAGGAGSSLTGAGGGGAGGHASRYNITYPGVGGGGGGGGYGSGGTGGGGYTDGSNGTGSASGAGGDAGFIASTANKGGGGGGGAGSYGTASLTNLFMGGGGGAGGGGQTAAAVEYAGSDGARGGGIVMIAASTVSVSGGVTASGSQASATANQYGGCGGGGAGGSVKIEGNTLTLGSAKVTASGGAAQSTTCNRAGGAGGDGRIATYYASSSSGTTTPTASATQVAYNTYGLYHSAPIATTNAVAFENIRWEGNLNTYGKLQVQTRSGATAAPTDGSWEAWKPMTVTTNYVNLHAADTHTLWTGTNATVSEGDVTRNVDMFEDEDESTVGNVTKIVSSTNGGYIAADVESGPKDISAYSYISFWVRASQPGNTLKIGFGETGATEQEQTVTIDATDTWQKVYWDISAIAGTSRDAALKLRITNLATSSNTFYIDNIKGEELSSTMTGSAITSTPNNYLQYRVVFTTTNTSYPPQLENVYITYNNGFKLVQADNNNVRLYNYSGKSQDLRLSVGAATGSGSVGSVTMGSMTGATLFADTAADDDWLGLGASAGRIEFDDQATDEVNILGANVGIGTSTPTSFALQVAGHIGPNASQTYDLGSTANRFRDLYLSETSILHVGKTTTDEGTLSYDSINKILNFGTDSTSNGDIAFFADDLYLDKSSGWVGIGTASPGAPLAVLTSGDNVGLVIGNSGAYGLQLGYYVTSDYGMIQPVTGTGWKNLALNPSGGNVGIGDSTPTYKLDVTGDVNLTGTLGVGDAGPMSTRTINASSTFAGSSSVYGIVNSIVLSDATLGANVTYTADYANVASSENTIGAYTQTLNGVWGRSQYSGSGVAAIARGVYGHVQNTSTGTISTATGVSALTDVTTASGTITTAYGVYADVNNSGSGTVTTGYGVYIGDVAATTDYGVYQVGANDTNYFAGSVGIGNASPASALDVNGRIRMGTWTADGDAVAYRDNATSNIALVTSDRRLKKNISPLMGSLDIAMQIKPYKYNDLDEPDGSKLRLGVMSQEVLPIIPELTFAFNMEGSSETYYSVHYDKLPVLLLGAIQEQQKQIEQLQASSGATSGNDQRYVVSSTELPEGLLLAGSANAGSYLGKTVHSVEPLTVANLDKYLGVKQLRQNSTQPASVENPDHAVNENTAVVLVEEGVGSDIVYGDHIAISPNIPGYGVKDSTGLQASIGWATTPINWALATDMIDGKKIAKVEVSLAVERPMATGLNANTANWLYDENSATLSTPAKVVVPEMTATIGNFNVLRTRTLNVNDLFLVDDAGNLATSGTILATALSTPVIKGVGGLVDISLATADKFKVTVDGQTAIEASVQGVKVNNLVVSDQQAGKAIIPAGETQIIVTSTLVMSSSVIVVTPNKPVTTAVVPGAGTFVIKIGAAQSEDVEVGWYIVNVQQ